MLPAAEFTCTSGRVIDFGIVSQQLRPLCTIRLDEHSPWSPHVGLIVAIAKKPQEVMVLREIYARPILQMLGPGSKGRAALRGEWAPRGTLSLRAAGC